MRESPLNSAMPLIETRSVSKVFSGSVAIDDISLEVFPGEVLCLLGDNGAGKSTLIKLLSGVLRPTQGEIFVDARRVHLASPRDARELGIATVHQYGGTVPLMSIGRNFFLGSEPTIGSGLLQRLDLKKANHIALSELNGLGIRRLRDANQLVGTLSGGERQALAIARAVYFGARVLILDEPTSALGVKESGTVLRLIGEARSRGVGIILVTHNAHHALSIGDRFAILIHGKLATTFRRGERSAAEVLNLMAGGEELQSMQSELEALGR